MRFKVKIKFESMEIDDIEAESEEEAEKIALREAKWPTPYSVEVEEDE